MTAEAVGEVCQFCSLKKPVVSGRVSTVQFPSEAELPDECGAPSPEMHSQICTREPGHAGDHVVCGLQFHAISVWAEEGK